MKVMISVDAHKGSHTAVAIDEAESELANLKVRATRHQLEQLLEWAAPSDNRIWAVESAWALGYLLSQQLLDAGEEVLDVPATLAARVRVLGSGRSNKNDPNDARSVRWPPCVLPRWLQCDEATTSACCASWPSATATWAEPATVSPVACTPC